MRKGALNDYARQIGCNKVAYAHHMDDIIETMFLSMFYEGQFYSFAPVTYLDRSGITVIRPLMYVPEANVIGFLHKYHLPLVKIRVRQMGKPNVNMSNNLSGRLI